MSNQIPFMISIDSLIGTYYYILYLSSWYGMSEYIEALLELSLSGNGSEIIFCPNPCMNISCLPLATIFLPVSSNKIIVVNLNLTQ